MFVGCLTYKPQFGILLPVALVASNQWRALISAVATIGLLAGASIVAFGSAPWLAFPRNLVVQCGLNLFVGSDSNWGLLQTIYGLARYLGCVAVLAGVAQIVTTAGLGLIVWSVCRSQLRYVLKAATLSAATLIATPSAFAYDLAAIAIPIAFLASDQLRHGFLRGEQTILLVLFGVVLTLLVIFADRPVGTTFGAVPLGPVVMFGLLGIALRRAWCCGDRRRFSENFCETILATGD